MAIKQTGQRWNPVLGTTKKKFILDTEADVANLPKCCPGSHALVVDGGIIYMVNASGEWTKMCTATATAGLAVAEEVSF